MKTYRIAVIAGDGIGQEVTPAAIAVLDAAAARAGFRFDWQHFPWGSQHYFDHGRMMPEDALDLLRPFDAILFGAVGDPRIQDNVTLNGLLLPIRRGFDQFACVRPAVLYPGVRCPLVGQERRRHRLRGHPREHRRGVRADRRRAARGRPARSRHADGDLHPARHRAGDPLRVRSGAPPEPQAAPHLGHQVERPGLQHGVLGPRLHRGRARLSRHPDRVAAGRRRVHGPGPPARSTST